MSDTTINSHIVTDFLHKLDCNDEEIKLYTLLVRHGTVTYLQAARLSEIERTKLYRIAERLIKKGLIEETPEFKRRQIRAADFGVIEMLIKQKELESKLLANSLPTFLDAMNSYKKIIPENKVIYYRGIEGIKQMTWNILRCKGVFRSYSYRFWNDLFGDAFVLKLNEELLYRNFHVHDLYSDEYLEFKKDWDAQGHGKPAGNWDFWDARYISEKVVKVNQNIDIYNDVVAYYYWQGDETFGVEIYNERVANFQKQTHDVLWKMSTKLPHFDWSKSSLK